MCSSLHRDENKTWKQSNVLDSLAHRRLSLRLVLSVEKEDQYEFGAVKTATLSPCWGLKDSKRTEQIGLFSSKTQGPVIAWSSTSNSARACNLVCVLPIHSLLHYHSPITSFQEVSEQLICAKHYDSFLGRADEWDMALTTDNSCRRDDYHTPKWSNTCGMRGLRNMSGCWERRDSLCWAEELGGLLEEGPLSWIQRMNWNLSRSFRREREMGNLERAMLINEILRPLG